MSLLRAQAGEMSDQCQLRGPLEHQAQSEQPLLILRWLQAGDGDSSCLLRPMTDAELAEQSRLVAGAA